jgi:alanine racemase
MTRSGVRPEKAFSLIQEIRLDPALRLTGIYTHLATADEKDKTAARAQLDCFRTILDRCGIGEHIMRHAANSAALIDLPESHLDMVRPGIAIYGYQPSDEMLRRLDLRPSLRLTGHLMQVKDVPKGTRCGYGLTYTFDRHSRIGLVPVGYGDGYLRALSDKASMRIAGADVPVRGRVSMDQTVIDLTDQGDASVGDLVEIISPDPEASNSVENLSWLAGSIPYELVSRLGARVRRFLVD